MVIHDLIEQKEGTWDQDEPYSVDPYNPNLFKQYYSDHHPIIFLIKSR